MAEKIFEELVSSGIPQGTDFNRWILGRFKDHATSCSLEEFASYYLSLVKSQTDEFIRNNTSTCNTPRKLTVGNIAEHFNDSIALQQAPPSKRSDDAEASFKSTPIGHQEGGPQDNRGGRRLSSRELFVKHDGKHSSIDGSLMNSSIPNAPVECSTPVTSFTRVNLSVEGTPANTSTPNSFKNSKNLFSPNEQSTMNFRHSSRNSLDLSSRNNSTNRRNSSSPLCLGDFLNTSTGSGKGGKKKNSSQLATLESTPKFSSSDFPTLGNDSPIEPKKSESKPKKRVVPIQVSRNSTPGTSNFISSSFQRDNNLLNLSAHESNGVDIVSELRGQREAISKDFSAEVSTPKRNLHTLVRDSLPASVAQSPRKIPAFQYDESKVEAKDLLWLMGKIYSFLLDMNFVSNILSEFSYFFSLLNTENEPFEQTHDITLSKPLSEVALTVLKNLQNCVFFTIRVLNCQKQNLGLLDVVTIRVLIDNERVQTLAPELFDHLRLVLQQKSQMEVSIKNTVSGSTSVVFFQQETDNRDNFPSDKEFGAFKKQRDVFYSILRSWELKHLDQAYDFRKDLGLKIRSLVTLMEHPINMAHLAKLFTAQLIISCNFDKSTNDLQMDLPNINLSKLSKLTQRLVAPSQFSTQYLFPGNQAFFRDFIVCCDQHMIFMEQLKISLIHELMQINDSSMETFCITPGSDEDNNDKSFREEFMVRAETMTTMRVLAKFVGFVVTRPYTYDGYRNTLVDQKQSQIRNLVRESLRFMLN